MKNNEDKMATINAVKWILLALGIVLIILFILGIVNFSKKEDTNPKIKNTLSEDAAYALKQKKEAKKQERYVLNTDILEISLDSVEWKPITIGIVPKKYRWKSKFVSPEKGEYAEYRINGSEKIIIERAFGASPDLGHPDFILIRGKGILEFRDKLYH